jgi:hypothetical protein
MDQTSLFKAGWTYSAQKAKEPDEQAQIDSNRQSDSKLFGKNLQLS